jgi:two-component system sensor kinase FixL
MHLEQLYKHLPLGLLLIDGNSFRILEVNHRMLEWSEYEREDLMGKPYDFLFASLNLAHRQEQKVLLKTKTGAAVAIDVNLSYLDEDQQYAVYIQSPAVLQSDLEDWQDKESRLEAVIRAVVDGIVTINKRGVILTANPAVGALFGYEEQEMIGQNVSMLMPEPQHSEHDQYLNNYQNSGKAQIIGIGREVMGLHKKGHKFPIHLSVSEVKLSHQTIYAGILHDLSAIKAAEEKVRRYATELERSNRELQDFAYVSSHDLQEPLRKIRAFGDRLYAKEADKLSEKGEDYLKRMVNAAERMQRLISDLLQFSRVSTHAKPFEDVDLNEVIKGVLEDLEYAIEESNAEIIIGDLPIIEAEPVQMRQLFQNLIGNAIKFRKEGVKPVVEVEAKILERKSYAKGVSGEMLAKIMVKDNGIGFNEEYKDKIFQIFQRLEGRKYEGSGIGLAICKRIATRHGGDIDAVSLPEQGATFIVTLALKQ